MQFLSRLTLGSLIAWSLLSSIAEAAEPDWVEPMRRVHASSTGNKGVLLQLGDSHTYSMAHFAPLQYADKAKLPRAAREALKLVDGYIQEECYRWKGGEKGNYSGQTAAWGAKNVEAWSDALKPEVAFVMFGTNDIRRGSVDAHIGNLRSLLQKCLDRGVVVILSTIPPMHGFDEEVVETVQRQRKLAAEMKVPLIDLYAHVVNRRPTDWDGTLEQFKTYSKWNVPTLVSQDGVHLSNPQEWKTDYTEQGLSRNGNTLRNYLSLMAYAEVINVVINGKPSGPARTSILGASPPKPRELPTTESPATGASLSNGPSLPPVQDWFPKAPGLPKPRGNIVTVDSVGELYDAVENAKRGQTILVAEGIYRMPRTLHIQADEVALRGATGRRTKVVLDFLNCRHHEGVAVSSSVGVTIADLTIANVRQNGIKINANRNADRVTIYNVVSHNVWQRHIKSVGVPDEQGRPSFVEDCRVQYCLFYNDRPKRRGDEPWEDSEPRMGFNYVGGMDVMNAKGWIVSDNVFTKIHGKTGEARGAIFMWHNSTDCVIERNIILDCDTGICLGNSSARGPRRHANRFLVRNNFIIRCPESNILADHTRDCKILNNTVHDPDNRMGRLLRVIHANDGLVVANNIFSGSRISVERYEGRIENRNNLVRPVGDYFVDAQRGDLHLTEKARDAIDKATADPAVNTDVDNQPRSGMPDLGADELGARDE